MGVERKEKVSRSKEVSIPWPQLYRRESSCNVPSPPSHCSYDSELIGCALWRYGLTFLLAFFFFLLPYLIKDFIFLPLGQRQLFSIWIGWLLISPHSIMGLVQRKSVCTALCTVSLIYFHIRFLVNDLLEWPSVSYPLVCGKIMVNLVRAQTLVFLCFSLFLLLPPFLPSFLLYIFINLRKYTAILPFKAFWSEPWTFIWMVQIIKLC